MDKPIYKSKTIQTAVVIAVIGVLQWYGIELPYQLIYTITGAFGLYGIRDAIGQNK